METQVVINKKIHSILEGDMTGGGVFLLVQVAVVGLRGQNPGYFSRPQLTQEALGSCLEPCQEKCSQIF